MDNGLTRVQHRKIPFEVLDVDLPDLALALTSVARGQATAQVVRVDDRAYVKLSGRGVATLVPRPAWLRILPLIKDGTLTTRVIPAEGSVRPFEATTRDGRDPLYLRIEAVLRNLFPSKVPTT